MLRTMKELLNFLQQSTEQGSQNYDVDRMAFQQLAEQLPIDRRDLTAKDIIHARCLLSEYADYYGQYRQAAMVLSPYAEAPKILDDIQQADPKRAARLCLQLGRVAYRKRRFKEAEALIERSVTGYKQRQDAFGMALACFYAAKVSHRLLDFAKARNQVHTAIAIFLDRDTQKSVRVATYRVALCKLLLARLAFREGNLVAARASLAEARDVLKDIDDPVNRGTLEDISGCVERASAQDEAAYERAEGHFLDALKLYDRVTHNTYLARVRNNLGYTYARMERLEEAEEQLKKALAVRPRDGRTPIETRYFLSRLYLRWYRSDLQKGTGNPTQLDAAERMARRAIHRAEAVQAPSLGAEARITLGRILLLKLLDNLSLNQAKTLAHEAQRLNHTSGVYPQDSTDIINPKVEIAFNLLMAEILCKATPPDRNAAGLYYKWARSYLAKIQNVYLDGWAARVEQELSKLDDTFSISPSVPSLAYPKYQEALRFWLVRQATARAGHNTRGRLDRQKIAALLDVERQTVEKWVKQWNDIRHNPGRLEERGIDGRALEELLAKFGLTRSQGNGNRSGSSEVGESRE